MHWLSVDPSIRSCGVVVWKDTTIIPVRTYLLKPNKYLMTWQERATDVAIQVSGIIRVWHANKVVCELPKNFDSNIAANLSGSILKLMYCVGAIHAVAVFRMAKFIPVPVNDWKGQLPKVETRMRVIDIVGLKACNKFQNTDVFDAAGIGLYHMGVEL